MRGLRRSAARTPPGGHWSIGCGWSDSDAVIVDGEPSATTSILRGFAFSLTGMVTLSTPLLYDAAIASVSMP